MSNKLSSDVWKQFDKVGKIELWVFARMFHNWTCIVTWWLYLYLYSSIKYVKQTSKDSESFLLNKNGEFNSAAIKAIYDLTWQFLKQKIRKESVLQVFSEIAVSNVLLVLFESFHHSLFLFAVYKHGCIFIDSRRLEQHWLWNFDKHRWNARWTSFIFTIAERFG